MTTTFQTPPEVSTYLTTQYNLHCLSCESGWCAPSPRIADTLQRTTLQRPSSIMANVHQQNLLKSISDLFNNPHYSDLTIECGGRHFYASKAIVCSVSPFLADECSSGMQRDHQSIIKHETFDADTMQRMLSYIYRQTYDVKGYANSLQI